MLALLPEVPTRSNRSVMANEQCEETLASWQKLEKSNESGKILDRKSTRSARRQKQIEHGSYLRPH